MKKEEIINLNRTLLYVSFGKMSKPGKSAMMRNLVRLGKHSKEIEEALKIAFDKFKPTGLDDLIKNKERSSAEQKELNELTKKFDDDIKDYSSELLNEDVEIKIDYISDADFASAAMYSLMLIFICASSYYDKISLIFYLFFYHSVCLLTVNI